MITTPTAAQRGASTYLLPWLISHSAVASLPPYWIKMKTAATTASTEDKEKHFGSPYPYHLNAELFGQEPVNCSHASHEKPDHHPVDVKDFCDVKVEKTEKEIRLDVKVGGHQCSMSRNQLCGFAMGWNGPFGPFWVPLLANINRIDHLQLFS